jgi:hypothetical protein
LPASGFLGGGTLRFFLGAAHLFFGSAAGLLFGLTLRHFLLLTHLFIGSAAGLFFGLTLCHFLLLAHLFIGGAACLFLGLPWHFALSAVLKRANGVIVERTDPYYVIEMAEASVPIYSEPDPPKPAAPRAPAPAS